MNSPANAIGQLPTERSWRGFAHLSMIGFGFGVGKIYDYLEKINPERDLDPIGSARIVGESFIAILLH
jgi:hypothetical protein